MPNYRRICLAKLEIFAIYDVMGILGSLSRRALEGMLSPDTDRKRVLDGTGCDP